MAGGNSAGDKGLKPLAQKPLPALPAPVDLLPKTATVVFEKVGEGDALTVRIVPPKGTAEITTENNEVALSGR